MRQVKDYCDVCRTNIPRGKNYRIRAVLVKDRTVKRTLDFCMECGPDVYNYLPKIIKEGYQKVHPRKVGTS